MTPIAAALGTRAVVRYVEPGHDDICVGCVKPIKWRAAKKQREVIANVYSGKRWDRVEHWHEACYADAGSPHGAPDASKARRSIGPKR